ncbi:MAG: biotin/lipoyl-containing protein, partial [Pseudomonadota bacterium]
NVVHLFERDCSLQRRHQKVIEEAPAPGMDEATREEICAAAVRAAKAVDYEGAGTIEFIADASEGLRADRIFFMEMNTRLQVEHPVTEEITGVDLVEWQLRAASGEPIPLKQEELSINGHAIEARLYAEDPAKGFLPSIGRLDRFDFHASGGGVRFDTGVEEGAEISPFYDPMIAKAIAHAETRELAIEKLSHILSETEIYPVKNNAGFVVALLGDKTFLAGQMTTGLIAARGPELIPDQNPSTDAIELAAYLLGENYISSHSLSCPGFRLNAPNQNTIMLDRNGQPQSVKIPSDWPNDLNATRDGAAVMIAERGITHCISLHEPRGTGQASAADGAILAPMPGKVIAVDVSEGDTVTAGQRLMVLEAMKMEHALTAPFDGTVTGLEASEGGQVQVEAVLCVVEPNE